MRRLVIFAAWLFAALLAAALAWVAFANLARSMRETQSVEQISLGRGRWVQAGDARIHLQEWGDPAAPVMLITHGTGAWSGTWFSLPDAMVKAGWRFVAIDLPPFGLSSIQGDAAADDYSRAAQARRVLGVIDGLGKPVTLVGHSFGAGPALEAALHAGPRVKQLVLVDPALGLGTQGEAPHCDANGGLPAPLRLRPLRTALISATATWPGLSATLLRQFVHRKDSVTAERVPAYQTPFMRQDFTASLGDWAAAFANASCEGVSSLRIDALQRWAANGPPLSLIWGEQDSITPIAQAHALKRWMPSATLHTLAGVGHIPHIEDASAFEAALAKVVGPPASK